MTSSNPTRFISGYNPGKRLVVRTPLVPISLWAQPADDSSNRPAELDGSVRFATALADAVFLEALRIGSGDLRNALERNEHLSERDGSRVRASVERYYGRAAARCTPFGLFAGVGVARLGDRTSLHLAERTTWKRHTSPDTSIVMDVAASVLAESTADMRILERNATLYRAGGEVRYVQILRDPAGWKARLCTAEVTEELDAVLSVAREAVSRAELVSAIAQTVEDREGAEVYIREMIQEGLLVSVLQPSVVGASPFSYLMARCGALNVELNPLVGIHERLIEADASGLCGRRETIESVARELSKYAPSSEPARGGDYRHLQVHLTTNWTEATVSRRVANDVLEALDFLDRLFAAVPRRDALSDFRDRFRSRFERESVPLGRALDDDIGVRFRFAEASQNNPRLGTPDSRDRLPPVFVELLELVYRARARGESEIVLGPDFANGPGAKRDSFPSGFSALVVISSAQAGEDANDIYLQSVLAPSAATLISRFAQHEPEIESLANELAAAERDLFPGRLVAEVAFQPAPKIANVSVRPDVGHFEIVTSGRFGVGVSRQLGLDDVSVALEGDRFVLRRISDGAQIEPRLSSAHNYSHPEVSGVHQFLAALQSQECGPMPRWTWGPLQDLAWLPRVRYGRSVLSLAVWKPSKDVLAKWQSATEATCQTVVNEWRAQNAVPRFVVIGEGDQFVPLDLDSAAHCGVLTKWSRNAPHAVVTELWPLPDASVVHGSEGRYANEVVIPFIRKARASAPKDLGIPVRTTSEKPVQRVFVPGDRWLFARIFCSQALVGRVVDEVVGVVADRLRRRISDANWHFVRYADPTWHVRFRMTLAGAGDWGWAIAELNRATDDLRNKGIISSISIDSYQREIERYGGSRGIEIAERLFTFDSEEAVALVRAGPYAPDELVVEVALHCYALLDAVGCPVDVRRLVAERCYSEWYTGLRMTDADRRWCQDAYRRVSKTVLRRVASSYEEERRARYAQRLINAGAQDFACDMEMLGHYLHMAINRRLDHGDRRVEVLIYFAVAKLVASLQAMGRESAARAAHDTAPGE